MTSLAPRALKPPAAPPQTRPLAQVGVGGTVIVRHLSLPRTTARRLFEMGLLPGTHVQVLRRAPLGDPIELRLRNYSLSIRLEEAALIEVEPVD